MIESGWTFSDVVSNIEALKNQYNGFLTSFSVFERKKALQLMRQFKTKIYSLHFEEYKRNLVWRYINDEIEYEELLILGGLNNGHSNKTND
jgi:hypothetical protein